MQEAKLQMVKLTDIVPSNTNTLQRDEWELKPEALKELAESIASKGVIQPILVRPDGSPGKYYLVCGERRFLASRQAGQKEIPAYIRDISDEEAFDLQITENLQRKDVHPLKEAQAYKALLDSDRVKNAVQELSKRFGKPVEYITHRLAFNNLIPEMKKEFFEGKMLIGHAILFSRLTEQDQKECMKICKPNYGSSAGQYESLKGVQSQIDQKLIRNLNKAPFNIHDANLVVNAGSCDTCPKRSGHNTLLFSDVKEKDRCFDGACFALKTSRYVITKLDELLLEDPELPVVGGGYHDNMDTSVKKHLEKLGIKVLKEWQDYRTGEKKDKGVVKAFCVSGNDVGQIVYIELIKKSKSSSGSSSTKPKPAKNSPAAIDEQIKTLRENLKREKEDMDDKVLDAIAERLMDLKPYQEPDSTPLTSYELGAMYRNMYQTAGFDVHKKIDAALKKINVDPKLSKEQQQLDKFAKLPDGIKNLLARKFISEDWDGGIIESDAFFVRRIAAQFKGMNVKAIEDQFIVDYNKKEIDTNSKIKALQEKKKGLAPAKSKSK
jgi:ParB/RepB/Spo0J family partition protein